MQGKWDVLSLQRLDRAIREFVPRGCQRLVRTQTELTYYWLTLKDPECGSYFINWAIHFMESGAAHSICDAPSRDEAQCVDALDR